MHAPPPPRIVPPSADAYRCDLADLRVGAELIRAMTIAAAGGHGLLFVGPPGAGSLMLARRLPGLLPDLTWEQAVDVARIHSAAGLRDAQHAGVATARPYRAPHHTISPTGLVGGGGGGLWPGEVSLAHLGVLVLQNVDEFHRASLEALRAPATTGSVTIQRGQHATTFPARCQLVGTATLRADADSDQLRQLRRINQTRDFFDLVVPVDRAASAATGDPATTSAAVRDQVLDARAVLASSLAPPPLSDRISRVALTIAALDGCAVPRSEHVDEAAQLTDAVVITAA